MMRRAITPENTVFVVLSFEGPDLYSQAGGLGVRVDNLSRSLAEMGFSTHLFFIGDPGLAGEETRCSGKLTLHRWCQWISAYHPHGVYDGEEGKLYDYTASLPPYVKEHIVVPAASQGRLVVILGEEWHTADAVCRLHEMLREDGLGDSAVTVWNANNTFSFDRIDWGRLRNAATITTVSRYMKHIMWRMGLNPLVVPNGIPQDLLDDVDGHLAREVRMALGADLILCKVARWDRDKRWNEAVDAVAWLKGMGIKAVLVSRGGIEPYGQEVMARARSMGLEVREAWMEQGATDGHLAALRSAAPADIIDVKFHMPQHFLRVLYRASDGVLANSGHEPFGLVGLEAMAAGGIVFTGCTGEDYAIPLFNTFVLETADPLEIVGYMMYLWNYPGEVIRIREAARRTARNFTWEAAVHNLVSKLENQARMRGLLGGMAAGERTTALPDLTIVAAPGRMEEGAAAGRVKREGTGRGLEAGHEVLAATR